MKFDKKKKIILIVAVVVLLILITILLLFKGDKKLLDEVETIIASQEKLEGNISSFGYTFEEPNIILNPYGNAPLTAIIAFETDEEEEVSITVVGKDKHTTFTEDFEENTEHYIPVLGLYPDKENEVIIKIGDEEKIFNIVTDKLPDNFALTEEVFSDKENLSDELYFVTPSAYGYTAAYDVNGDVRWYLTDTLAWRIFRLENGNLLLSTERIVNVPYYNTGLYEIDMLGKIHNEYSIEGGYHHDVVELENGNLLALSEDFSENTVEDHIVEIDRETGDIIKDIDLKDILNTEDGKNEAWVDYDWFHNNSVWFDKETNSLTLSGRHQDAVINIDYDTEKLNWIIGDPTGWSDEYQKYFFEPVGKNFEWQWFQHAAMILPNGDVFILDNGNNKSKIEEEYVAAEDSYTRGVIYDIDTEKMTIEQVWEYGKERGSEFYSPYVSDVDYIDEDHYIVHSGGIVYVDGKIANSPAGLTDADKLDTYIVEILDDGVIFELKLPTNTYRVEKMDMYDNTKVSFEDVKRLGTLGKTIPTDEKFGIIVFEEEIDEEYTSREIEINKEIDRLTFEGDFKREDEVSVILTKGLEILEYDLVISSKPYTALCIDIFTQDDEDNEIYGYKFINEEGLSGEYDIYVKLNGKTYNTGKEVVF